MRHYTLLFLLLLTFHLPAISQQIPSVNTEVGIPADTVAAVRRLFELRREGAGVLMGGSTALILIGGAASRGSDGFGSDQFKFMVGIIATGACVAAPLAVGIAKRIRFSHRKEAALLTAYQRGQPLPKKIRRRLREKHFQPKEPSVDPSIN